MYRSGNPTLRERDIYIYFDTFCSGFEQRFDFCSFSSDPTRTTCPLDDIMVVQCVG